MSKLYSHQDLTQVILSNPAKQQKTKVITEKKGDTSVQDGLRKLDNDTENFVNQKIPMALSKEIMQSRILSKLTQKEIAIKLNIQQNVYTELENGKAIYNPSTKQLITKLQNILKIKFQHR